ncbi:MAG: hypothetical protein PVG79_00880 [Gemmatimonadales bacterium]|jgi:hypothetical protein
MAENTHYFAANVRDPAELKRLLIEEKIPAIIDPCEYEALGRGRFADRPADEQWLLLLSNSENWDRLTGLLERLVEIEDFEGRLWRLAVSWNGQALRGTFYAEDSEQESTVYSAAELGFLSRFFNKDESVFARYLKWGCAAEFCAAVGIPFIEMVDQDSTIAIPKLDDAAGYVFLADEVPD